VLSGMEVVDKIVAAKTHTVGGHDDVPVEPILIKSVTIKQ
jgi:cyclophilin family peptidyl-prolyl cis-trans isomerase